MNNSKNKKKLGVELLQQTQILSQNNAITVAERNAIASAIKDGMASGTFEVLEKVLMGVLETTTLPEVVEEMLSKV